MKITYFLNKAKEEINEVEISNVYFSHKKGTALIELLNGERKEMTLDMIVLIKS